MLRRAGARLVCCSGRPARWRSRRPADPWKPPAQSGPAVHGTRFLPGPVGRVLLGLLQDLDQPPPLGGRQRPGLHDLDAVADAGDAGLVVRLQLAGPADDLAVQAVLHAVLDLDDDGLLHLVADDEAFTDLAVPATGQAGARRLLGLAHATPSFGATDRPSSRSRMIV